MRIFRRTLLCLILSIVSKETTSQENGTIPSQENGTIPLRLSKKSCTTLNTPCQEDCECCKDEINHREVRCEKRNQPLGYQCYISVGLGGGCDHDHECRSQKCENRCCVQYFSRPPKVPTCSLTKDYISARAIIGTRRENVCKCDAPSEPTTVDAHKALDGNDSTIYVNNWAIDGGIEVQPKYNEGLHSIRICNADDCPECDPTCYKIEGLCLFNNNIYETIQEGPLSLPVERNQCVTIGMKGKPLCTSYKITFPCQRGTCRDSCKGSCNAAPLSNPKKGPCDPIRDHYIEDGIMNYGSMKTFKPKVYDSANNRTIFYYEVNNIDLRYALLTWEGDCMIDCYYVFKEVNGKLQMVVDSKGNFRACGNNFVTREGYEDPITCMQGLQIKIGHGFDIATYIVKIFVRGKVEATMLTYGMFGGKGTGDREYGKVLSPKCPNVMCPATCPLKLSEISLYTQECPLNEISPMQ